MTKEEKEKAIDTLKISAPVMAMTQEEFNDYIQTLNKVMDWLEQEPKTGHWIERRNRATGRIESVCSECGAEEGYPYNIYCGNCGCRMFEPQESEDK